MEIYLSLRIPKECISQELEIETAFNFLQHSYQIQSEMRKKQNISYTFSV